MTRHINKRDCRDERESPDGRDVNNGRPRVPGGYHVVLRRYDGEWLGNISTTNCGAQTAGPKNATIAARATQARNEKIHERVGRDDRKENQSSQQTATNAANALGTTKTMGATNAPRATCATNATTRKNKRKGSLGHHRQTRRRQRGDIDKLHGRGEVNKFHGNPWRRTRDTRDSQNKRRDCNKGRRA